MEISRVISLDIIQYLKGQKGMSISEIAEAMSTTPTHIQEIINKKTKFTSEDLNEYLKNKNIKFWEFALEAIPQNHLSPQAKKKIQICKELNNRLKKVRKNIKK